MDGVDLEDAEGTEEEFTGHWERNTLFNEIMTASGMAERPQTNFTLSLLEVMNIANEFKKKIFLFLRTPDGTSQTTLSR